MTVKGILSCVILCGVVALVSCQQTPLQQDEQRGDVGLIKPLRREKRFLGSVFKAISCFFGQILVNGQCQDPEPKCDGRTTGDGGCDAYYANSHLIDTGGNQITSVDGDCPSDNNCNCPMAGFYSAGGHCALCTDIAYCNYETCSNSGDQICSYCEGVVQDIPGWRAYKMSADKRSCDQACSWRSDSNRCYPGSCSTELVGSCVCASSFSGIHCRTISDTADIVYNALTLETTGTNEIFPPDYNNGPSATQNDAWTNDINPDSIMYEFHSQFQRAMPALPAYIKSATVGVSAASAQLQLRNKAGTQKGSTLSRTCSGISTSSPNTNMFTCKETLQSSFFSGYLPTPFQHEDRLDFTFNAVAGGQVVMENKETIQQTTDNFVTTTKTHTFQIHFDTVDPYHCLTSCSDSMLDTEQIITTADVTIAWGGWADDAAGIWKYGYRAYDLTPINGVLQHASIDEHGTVATNAASGSHTFTLNGPPGIYAVILDCYDRAGNIESARKLVLYDDGSQITRNDPTYPLRVTSAASVTSWQWQHTEGPVTLTWDGRYTNVFHDHNKVNNAVAPELDVESNYDDNEGNMTVSALDNALGIVKFTTAYSVDNQGGTTLSLPSDSQFSLEPDLSGTNTYQANVVDGDTLIFWVRAYDIRSEYDEESVTVHIDSSPPIINDLWLTKDHILNLSVHGIEELKEMTIEWEAYDEHSGLREVQWRVFDNFTGTDIVHGQEFVTAQGQLTDLAHCQSSYANYIRGPNCYCTGPVGCYHRHFQVKPILVDSSIYSHGGVFHDKNTPVHDYDYFLEVTVYNHANLTTTLRRQITVDLSPPHPGEVHDGVSGSPEVDYQATTDLHAYWWGFFDRESGVKYYQYAFDTACVDASAFSHDTTDARVTETYDQFASWTAPGDGTYKVTVVAFNSAREPSVPVCSDGVIVDTTPPTMSHFYVDGAHIAGGVVPGTTAAEVWFIDSKRRRRLVDSPDSACTSAASGVSLTLENYAVSPLTSPMNATEACAHGALASKFVDSFYLSRDMHLYLNWTGSDADSGIFDYEVGLATTSAATVPDISGYQSTSQHTFYQQHHPTLTEGTPFYILIKAIDKAGVETVQALGPAQLVRTAPTYTGSVTMALSTDTLQVTWSNNLFTDVETSLLDITVSLEEQTSGAVVHPYAVPQFSGTCTSATPPSCATFAVADLHWGLHEKHVYVAKIKVTNIVGFDLQLTSDPYTHDTRLAAAGSVYEMVPSGEETTLGIQRSEDTDFQLGTSTLEAAWSGFEDGSQVVTYTVGLGTSAGADDVSSFVSVSSQTEHMFSSLSLQVNTKYYVTVQASTTAGSTSVTSDGVTVIQASQTESGITVMDGPGCNVTSIPGWTPDHHQDTVTVPCEDDAIYQTSVDTLWGHWTLTAAQRHRYPDIVYKVQKNIPGTSSWPDVTTYSSSPRNDVILAQGLPLQAGGQYRLAVKFCVAQACTNPVYSSGVFVISNPAASGGIAVVHSNSTGVSTLAVTMEDFRDPDISDLTEAQSAVLGYQWSLSHRLQDSTERLLTPWVDVSSLTTVNSTYGQFTITLTGELSFHKCLILTVRGVSKVGMVTLLTSDVIDCQAIDPALVVPRAVMDTVGLSVEGSPSEGLPITLGLNDPWTADDDDYTPHTNIISAVWPTLRQSQITWAVLESQGPDVTSHFLNPASQPLQDPCTSPLQIACGQLTSQKYINVDFGPGTPRSALQHGHHYYVCVHAQAESVTYEKWVEELPEVSVCSDGVTVDLTPPVAGVVSVDGLRNVIYQTSLSVISLRWNGFTDVEDMGLTSHHSGIRTYELAVGSVEGGEDVLKFMDVGLVNYYTLHSLAMQDGHVYYVTVKALDMVGRSVTASSDGFVVDSTTPERTAANFRFAAPYFTSAVSIDLCWTDMFSDAESGIDYYLVTVGSRPGHDDIMLSQQLPNDCGIFNTDVTMINGHAYYVTVGAVNGAGLETVETSKPVAVMTTVPSPGSVFDGPPPGSGATATDLDFVTSPQDVVAFWSGFSTPLNPVTSYSVSLGTCPGCVDVIADFDIGLAYEVSWSHAPLRHDIRYYTTVIACNAVGHCNTATSDGVMIDVTPPVTGPVWDGTGDEDITYQSQTDFLGAQWRGFSDLGSGLTGFTWRAGTTAGGSDVMPERDVGLVFSTFTKDLPSSLPVGQTIYITVKATDAAGNQKEATSNGFQVDTSAPVTSTVVELSPGVGTLDAAGVVSQDMIGVRWAIDDAQSNIGTQYLSVYSHIYGEFQSAPVQVPGPARDHIITSLSLHDGSNYKVKVTACNLARLCTTSTSADILHDSSPPSTGMFAIDTDHTANLERHLATWMQWTSSTLRLAWLGFHDEHSGVHSYQVNVGTTPFAKDLNQGSTTVTVPHSNSGTSYEDEGYVQVYEVNTQTLTALQDVYVTIWAINGVGLKSHPAMSMFRLEMGGALFLHRRCTAFNCLSHCSCAIQGATCGAATTCTDYTGITNPNSMLTVYDHADLTQLSSASPVADSYQASLTYIAATWQVTTSQGQLPIRYEISAGRSDQSTPLGIFSIVDDRVWRDVGLETSSVIMVPTTGTLVEHVAYSTFVRAWYADGSYAVFKSSGITPRAFGPTTTTLVGRAVKEHSTSSATKDEDFLTSSNTMYVSWDGKFVSNTAPVTSFNIYIGTRPEASDIYSGTESGSAVSHMVVGLSLNEATVYYSTVTAVGGSGLLAWDVSDGFIMDTQVPEDGLVMDGTGLHDLDYQPSDSVASATWRGFYDAGSGVRRYMWCVGTTSDVSLCDVISWTDVGLNTSTTGDIPSSVSQGTTIYSKVYAQDAAGHSSSVAVSDGVTVDTSAPSLLSMVYTNGINWIYNPSFETDTALNADLTQCDAQPPSSWQITSGSCVTLHRPTHTVSSEGVQHLVLSGTLYQSVSSLTPGNVYRLSMRLAHPHNALASQKPVTGYVTLGSITTPFELDPSLCRGVCDTDLEPVMLWHSFSYVVTASSSTIEISISTSVTSLDQQVAVDDVVFEEIREMASPGSSSEESVKAGGVFLAEWSVVQASWHFTDDVSPIVDYQWALGTSRGGVQLQGFRSVGRQQHASRSGLSLTHGTGLYVTVLARNAAGRTTVAYSQPLIADMTAPDIVDLIDGASGDDVDYQTATVISARWSVSDQESDPGSCQWAIGTLAGRGDIQTFQSATATGSNAYSVSTDVTATVSSLTLPVTLYVSVRCYNRAGLPARAVTDGVTIVSSAQNQQAGTLQILPDSGTQYPVLDSCHAFNDKLRLRWSNIVSEIPVAGYEIVLSTGSGQNSSQTPTMPYLLDGAELTLNNSLLAHDNNYTVSVNTVDIFGTVSLGASRSTYVLPEPPVINANERLTSSVTGGVLTLSWPNLFTSVLDLKYEVSAGSVPGGGDILLWQETQSTTVDISLQYATASTFNMSVVVTAFDPCGQFSMHTEELVVVS